LTGQAAFARCCLAWKPYHFNKHQEMSEREPWPYRVTSKKHYQSLLPPSLSEVAAIKREMIMFLLPMLGEMDSG
jgi:hypothetical protein